MSREGCEAFLPPHKSTSYNYKKMNRLQDGNLRRPPVNGFHKSFCLNKEENLNWPGWIHNSARQLHHSAPTALLLRPDYTIQTKESMFVHESLCVSVCVCVCVCVCTSVCLCSVHIVYMCAVLNPLCLGACVCVCLCAFVRACVHMCVSVFVYTVGLFI